MVGRICYGEIEGGEGVGKGQLMDGGVRNEGGRLVNQKVVKGVGSLLER